MAPEVTLQRPATLQEHCVAASRRVAAALRDQGSSSCSVWERCKSVAQNQQLQRPGALQEAYGSFNWKTVPWPKLSSAGALRGPRSSSCSAWESCRSVAPEAVAASGHVAGGPWQLQPPAGTLTIAKAGNRAPGPNQALQEPCVAPEAVVAASRSVQEARGGYSLCQAP